MARYHRVCYANVFLQHAMTVCVAANASGTQTCPLQTAMAVCVVVQSTSLVPDVAQSKYISSKARCQATVPSHFASGSALVLAPVDAYTWRLVK